MNRADQSPNDFEAGRPISIDRHHAEAAIEDLRRKGGIFVEAVRATRMPMALTDPNLPGNPIVFANEAFLKLTGYRMDEVLGQQPHFMNGRMTNSKDAARFAEAIRGDQDDIIETIQYRKNGSRFVATVLISAFKDETGRVANHFMSWLDVTRRVNAEEEVVHLRQTENALRESEARLAAAFESVPAGVAAIGLDGRVVVANAEYRRFLPGGFIPSRDAEGSGRWRAWDAHGALVDPQEYPGARALRGETVVPGQEMLFTDDDGREIWTNVATAPTYDQDGNVTGIVSVISDIDDSKRAQEALRESEERLRLIVENAEDYAIFTTDPEGIVLDWRDGAEAVFGYSRGEMLGQDCRILFTPEDREQGVPEQERGTAAATGKAGDVRWHVRKDGSRVFIDGVSTALRGPGGAHIGFLKIGQDITDKHRASEMQATLLAELHHRVRNLLALVRSVIRRTSASKTGVEEFVQHLEGRIDAMARTQALLTRTPGRGVDLEEIIRDEMVAQSAREPQFKISGPAVEMSPKAAEVLTLAIHELATNSVKYGALGKSSGDIRISWSTEERNGTSWLTLDWTETGIDVPRSPEAGFGTELITRRVPYELKGKGEMRFSDRRLNVEIEFPVEHGQSILQTDARMTSEGVT